MITVCLANDDPDGALAYVHRGLDDPSLQEYLDRREQGIDLCKEESDNAHFFCRDLPGESYFIDGYYVETE
jgi:hypothetical protein